MTAPKTVAPHLLTHGWMDGWGRGNDAVDPQPQPPSLDGDLDTDEHHFYLGLHDVISSETSSPTVDKEALVPMVVAASSGQGNPDGDGRGVC